MMYAAFIKGINSKSKDSWKKLYCYYYAALCNYSYKITCDKSVSEDIIQTIFIKLWEKNVFFDNISSLTSYLYKATYTQSLNFIRDNKKNTSINNIKTDSYFSFSSSEDDYIKMAIDEEIISQFYRALENMSPRQKEVLLMTMKGDKIEEIAAKLDLSINSIKTHKKRAFQFLRKNLGDNFFIIVYFYCNYLTLIH